MSAVMPRTEISAAEAFAFAEQHGVEQWFDRHVIHPRTRQDRVAADQLLKQREADRFQRLQLLIERAAEAFDNEAKGLYWLTRKTPLYGGISPLEHAAWEAGFLAVLHQLRHIEFGVYI